MSLTVGTAPFGPQSAGEWNFDYDGPAHALYLHPQPRRLRAVFDGETVLDTSARTCCTRPPSCPATTSPPRTCAGSIFEPTDHTTHCPFKGDARYWTLRVGDRVAENVVWDYPEPIEGAPDSRGPRLVLLGAARPLVRGGRGGLRPPARPLPPRRRAAHLAARAGLARRHRAGRHHARPGPARDRPARALVHPARGRAPGPPRARRRPEDHVPVQGHEERLLVGRRRARPLAWTYAETLPEVAPIAGPSRSSTSASTSRSTESSGSAARHAVVDARAGSSARGRRA